MLKIEEDMKNKNIFFSKYTISLGTSLGTLHIFLLFLLLLYKRFYFHFCYFSITKEEENCLENKKKILQGRLNIKAIVLAAFSAGKSIRSFILKTKENRKKNIRMKEKEK